MPRITRGVRHHGAIAHVPVHRHPRPGSRGGIARHHGHVLDVQVGAQGALRGIASIALWSRVGKEGDEGEDEEW